MNVDRIETPFNPGSAVGGKSGSREREREVERKFQELRGELLCAPLLGAATKPGCGRKTSRDRTLCGPSALKEEQRTVYLRTHGARDDLFFLQGHLHFPITVMILRASAALWLGVPEGDTVHGGRRSIDLTASTASRFPRNKRARDKRSGFLAFLNIAER